MFFNSNSNNTLNNIAKDFQNKDLSSLENTSKYYSENKKEHSIYLFSFLSHIFLKISPIINFIIKQILNISSKMSNFNVILSHHSKQLNKTSEILKSSSEELLSSMEESSESLNNITMSISSNTESLDIISSNANDIISGLEKDDEILEEISSVNSNIINNSNDMKNNMTNLDKVIKDINKIVEGINETANSTNLLALNASIEAARAGEHGKGFAVVASEIKELSENTQKQLAFIQNFINEIKQASSKSNESIENTLFSIDEMGTCINYMKESFDKTKISTKDIVTKIENISSNMEEITAVSEEINATSDIISDNAQNLVTISDDIFTSSEDIETISKDLDNVDNILTELGNNTSLLNKINMFKLTNTDLITNMNNAIEAHKKWVDSIKYMAENMVVKPIQTDNHKCVFGHFYYALTPVDKGVLDIWESVDEVHEKLHKEGEKVIAAINANDKQSALTHSKIAEDCSYIVIEKFNTIKNLTEILSQNNKYVF